MINLNGHSGCNVVLYDNNIVRKVSPTLEYNHRLKIQMEKQQSYYLKDKNNLNSIRIFQYN